MNQRRASALLGLTAALAIIASCSRQSSVWTDDEGLLKYVPADTPYLFAALTPAPDELFDKLDPWIASMLESYRAIMDAGLSQATSEESGLSDEQRQQMLAVGDIADELLTPEGWRNAGLTRESRVVLYGRGLLPVLRVTLSDGALFESLIDRVETATGSKLPVATVGEHSYRYFETGTVRLVLAVQDNELIATVAPMGISDEHLMGVLEGTLSGESIAASGKLRDLAADHGFSAYQIGFIDVDRLAATMLEPQSGTNAELLALAGYDPSVMLSDECRTEFGELANVAPRIVLGSTVLNADEISGKAVLELRSDIAAALVPVAASVPGLGTISEGLVAFGMGLNVAAARDFVESRLDAIQADPFTCEQLQGIAQGVPAVRQALNSPVPPFVNGIRGFVAVLDDIRGMNLAANQPPTGVDLRLLLASDDAADIVAMAKAFIPQIATLNLEADGTPVRIDVPPEIGPMVAEAYAALTQQAVAVAVGNDSEARLRSLLAAPAGDPMFLSSDIDLGRYYGLIGEMSSLGAQNAAVSPELSAAMNDLMKTFGEGPFDRSRGDVRFTERGVEMRSTVTLSD